MNLFLLIFAYLSGSVPFAIVIGKGLYGKDVRKEGSGNAGTTNVFRVLGKTAGTLVFLGDVGKGWLPVFLTIYLTGSANVAVLAASAAILGHTFPVWLKFKGGKGVATGLGAVIGLFGWMALLPFAVFWIVLLMSSTVSISSLAAVSVLLLWVFLSEAPNAYKAFVLIGGALIVYLHRANLVRVRHGKESLVPFGLLWWLKTGSAVAENFLVYSLYLLMAVLTVGSAVLASWAEYNYSQDFSIITMLFGLFCGVVALLSAIVMVVITCHYVTKVRINAVSE